MTDAQFATLISVLGAGLLGIGGAIRWAVTRITKAMDDQSASNLRLADAQIDLAGANAAQRADIDHITRWIYAHTPGAPQPIERERTPVQAMPAMTPTRMRAFGGEYDEDPIEQRPGSRRRSEAGPARRSTPARGVVQDDDTPNYRGPFRQPHDDDER